MLLNLHDGGHRADGRNRKSSRKKAFLSAMSE
jgi:hypothetical protein